MGPNNTNTPTPTPSNNPGAAPGASPTPPISPVPPSAPTPTSTSTSTPTPTPAFSGPAPATNPFSGQNIIPSSATGDIILEPDSQPQKSKKPLIIALIFIVLLVVGGIIAVLVLKPNIGTSNSSNNPTNISFDELSQLNNEYMDNINTLEKVIYFGTNLEFTNSDLLSTEFHESLASYYSSLEEYYNKIQPYKTIDGYDDIVDSFQKLKDTISYRMPLYETLIENQKLLSEHFTEDKPFGQTLSSYDSSLQTVGKELDQYLARKEELDSSPIINTCNIETAVEGDECYDLAVDYRENISFLNGTSIAESLFSNIRQNIDFINGDGSIYKMTNNLMLRVMHHDNQEEYVQETQ